MRPEVALLRHGFTRGMIEQRFRALFADPDAVDPSSPTWWSTSPTHASPGGRVAFLAALRRVYLDAPFSDDGFFPRLAELAAPSLFVWGEHDEVIRPFLRHHVAQWLPSAEQVVLKDSGHIPQVERPERVGELLHAHVARAGAPTSRGRRTTAAA